MPRRANAAMNGNVIEQDGGDGAKTRPGNPRWRQGEGSRATSPNRLAMTTATKLPGSRLQAKTWGKLILGKNTYQHVKWIAIWKKNKLPRTAHQMRRGIDVRPECECDTMSWRRSLTLGRHIPRPPRGPRKPRRARTRHTPFIFPRPTNL